MAEVMEWIKSLSNDELVQHLMNEYGYKCGPITVSTRSVYEKKLQSFKNHTTISGKTIPVSQQETRTDQIRTDQIRTNGSNHNHEEGEEEEDAGRSVSGSSPRKGRRSLPLPSSPSTRSKSGDPMRDVKIPSSQPMQPQSRKAIDLNYEEEEESRNQRRSSRRVTIAATPRVLSGKKSLRISTPGPSSLSSYPGPSSLSSYPGPSSLSSYPGPSSLSAYSSAEEDEGVESEDLVNELPGQTQGVFGKGTKSAGKPSSMKSPRTVTPRTVTPRTVTPRTVTPTAQGMQRVRTSTPMTRMAINTSVFGNSSVSSSISSTIGKSSISSSTIGKRGSSRSTRIPSSLRVDPPSPSSLASFSDDNDSENEPGGTETPSVGGGTETPSVGGGTESPSVNLLRYRPRVSMPRGSSRVRSPLANITTQATDNSPLTRSFSSFLSSSASNSPSSWISISILLVALLFFISIFSFYFYSRITSSSHVHPDSSSFGDRVTASSFGDRVTASLGEDKATKSEEDAVIAKINAPICSSGQSSLDLCLKSKNHVRPALVVIQEVMGMFESQCISHFCESSEDPDPRVVPSHDPDPSVMSLDSFRFHLVPILTNSPSFLKLAREKVEVERETRDDFVRMAGENSVKMAGENSVKMAGENSVRMAGENSVKMAGESVESEDEGVLTLLLVNQAISDSLVLLELNPKLRIRVVRGERNLISHLKIDLKTFPIHWPWMCRITMAVIDAIWILTILSLVLFASFSLYYFINLNKKRRSEEEELKYELIEKSLELLQSPDEPQSMPILHIRDTLISPLDRTEQKNIRVWNEVVRFIEENESRVKIDSEVIDGETYRTWKWVASQVPIDGSIKTGDIEWQGQAFNENDAAKSTPSLARKSMSRPPSSGTMDQFVAPTAFIKARNFFDIDQVRNTPDTSWKIPIKDAILQKCSLRAPDGDHGILHMVFDSDHPREALVYMRCKNIESATNAYLALHGWWCERRLVSVRFLKDDRYFQRFPDARHCSTSLKCSSE